MSNARTRITLAVIACVGTAIAAVFGNYHQIFGVEAAPIPAAEAAPSMQQRGDHSLQMSVSGSNNVISTSAPSRPCRDISHGIERYARTFDVTQTSGWKEGGYSQVPWCNDVKAELRRTYPDADLETAASSERSRNHGCKPLKCMKYQYTCTIHVKADPIYKEALTGACN